MEEHHKDCPNTKPSESRQHFVMIQKYVEGIGFIDDVIVVIDDPASSLDDGRAFATVQEIRELVGRANQVIVLAHSRPILC